MSHTHGRWIVVLGVTCGFASLAMAQNSRGSDRWRLPSTPEQREEYYRQRIDRYVQEFSDAYQLSDPQKEVVRQRLQQIREQDRPASDQRWQQITQIHEQFQQLHQQRDAGQPVDSQRYRELGNQMDTIRRSSPWMNRDQVASEVEKLLPPDQAATGRAKLQEQRSDSDRRREEMRQRWQQWQSQGGDPAEFWRQQGGRDRGRGRRDRGSAGPDSGVPGGRPDANAPQQAPSADPSTPQADQGRDSGDGDRRRDDGRRRWSERRGRDRDRREDSNPLGSWERYVRDFTSRYHLDPAQQEIAQSALREQLAQRKSYTDAHRDDVTAAEKIEDAQQRQQRLDGLNAPVVRLYEELKSKLDRIPTVAQRQAFQERVAASQPASGGVRGSDATTTRPSSERRSRSRRSRGSDEQ